MSEKLIKYGKCLLSFLYVFYIVIIVLNVVFQSSDASNGMIETRGTFGYIITYGLNLLLACGFFVISTIIQLIIYHVKKKNISEILIPIILFEVVKILGNSIYIYMIDLANIKFGGIVTTFIILGIIFFAIISVIEIAMIILMKMSEVQKD